ncbi:DUF5054 domain-containing protein [Aquihabitans sp. McL0605]|uniref:DUF5054 domain-containing protein n=1 Tax=Aquihabitans sp. McL0605 TaxID=3415671 RepID=UPI003CF15A05
MPIRVVHLVAKTHLDLGFTALAAEVEAQYLADFFPRAVAMAGSLRARGGPERLVWTTGSWILQRALDDPDAARAASVAGAVARGDLAWHALPVTTHTELADATLFRHGLAISGGLDRRFGVTTTAAKMTDVPGHTRAMVPLLAEAGVTLLHLGVNPAWPVPDVPSVFRWQSPDGAEVTVAYQAGGYGGEVVVPGCDEALAFLHAGDNLGPPSADDVLAAHADLRACHPGAEVRASTLDAFARAVVASGAVAALPVVTAEIGDPWLFGAGSDPQKVAAFRRALRAPGRTAATDARLLLVAEHTWGLDQKVALPEDRQWDRAGLTAVRRSDAGHRFEASWTEQRAYLDGVAPVEPEEPVAPWIALVDDREAAGFRRIAVDEVVEPEGWSVGVGLDGAVRHLVHRASGRVLADVDNPLGLVRYQSFDESDYDRFYGQLTPAPEDEAWARWDNTKPGIDAAGAVHGRWRPEVTSAWFREAAEREPAELVVELAFERPASDPLGAPARLWVRWTFDPGGGAAEATVWWTEKRANRLPEATWCSFVPVVTEPERWEIDKLGQRISPLDVVRRGGRALHAVGEGMHHHGPDGGLTIATVDAPLVAPGAPDLLDADPPLPDLAGGFHVLLHDNCWGTNFPMWNEGPARFRFRLVVS